MQNLVYFHFEVFFQNYIGHWSHLPSKIHYLSSAIYDLIYWLIVNEVWMCHIQKKNVWCVYPFKWKIFDLFSVQKWYLIMIVLIDWLLFNTNCGIISAIYIVVFLIMKKTWIFDAMKINIFTVHFTTIHYIKNGCHYRTYGFLQMSKTTIHYWSNSYNLK